MWTARNRNINAWNFPRPNRKYHYFRKDLCLCGAGIVRGACHTKTTGEHSISSLFIYPQHIYGTSRYLYLYENPTCQQALLNEDNLPENHELTLQMTLLSQVSRTGPHVWNAMASHLLSPWWHFHSSQQKCLCHRRWLCKWSQCLLSVCFSGPDLILWTWGREAQSPRLTLFIFQRERAGSWPRSSL